MQRSQCYRCKGSVGSNQYCLDCGAFQTLTPRYLLGFICFLLGLFLLGLGLVSIAVPGTKFVMMVASFIIGGLIMLAIGAYLLWGRKRSGKLSVSGRFELKEPILKERVSIPGARNKTLPSKFEKIITKSADEAANALCEQAILAVPAISEDTVRRHYLDVSSSWDSKQLYEGSIAEIHSLVLENLQRLGAGPGFQYFEVKALNPDDCAQVSTIFIKGGYSFQPVRIWRSQQKMFACGNAAFRQSTTIKTKNTESAKTDSDRPSVKCPNCGTSMPYTRSRCPNCKQSMIFNTTDTSSKLDKGNNEFQQDEWTVAVAMYEFALARSEDKGGTPKSVFHASTMSLNELTSETARLLGKTTIEIVEMRRQMMRKNL